jgi:hypothetical protein
LRDLELAAGARPLDRRAVITALGIAQILAWGTSFYFPAVFAEPIASETGWSLGLVVGAPAVNIDDATDLGRDKTRGEQAD